MFYRSLYSLAAAFPWRRYWASVSAAPTQAEALLIVSPRSSHASSPPSASPPTFSLFWIFLSLSFLLFHLFVVIFNGLCPFPLSTPYLSFLFFPPPPPPPFPSLTFRVSFVSLMPFSYIAIIYFCSSLSSPKTKLNVFCASRIPCRLHFIFLLYVIFFRFMSFLWFPLSSLFSCSHMSVIPCNLYKS